MEQNRTYICIDLKSFYASVECHERKLDPLTTNLVVADIDRTEKTICLAVSPALKSYGIPGRLRLFEVNSKLKEVNEERKKKAKYGKFIGESFDSNELKSNYSLSVGYIAATPRMALYIKYSAKIYNIYLKYISKEDIHVYSIDEVFMDVTNYLKSYKLSAEELARKMIKDVLSETGITATAGIGTNMYLAKVAMDIVAKHKPADENGVRIAILDELSYRKLLWDHRPLTDFWRLGRGYANKLENLGLFTMGDIARCSLGEATAYHNEDLLYKTFGINAELLIDHAWGYEPTTMEDIKRYKPSNNSISTGQVLHCAYDYKKAKLIAKEMADQLMLDLFDKHFVTDVLCLYIGYDIENMKDPKIYNKYKGEVVGDYLGRAVPKYAHGSICLNEFSSSSSLAINAISQLFDEIVNKNLLVRRINIAAGRVVKENSPLTQAQSEQLNIFFDSNADKIRNEKKQKKDEKEKKSQEAILAIKKKFGKNSIVKGMNLEEGSTAMERNKQIGGHKA